MKLALPKVGQTWSSNYHGDNLTYKIISIIDNHVDTLPRKEMYSCYNLYYILTKFGEKIL